MLVRCRHGFDVSTNIILDVIIALNIATVYWTYPETRSRSILYIVRCREANLHLDTTLEEVSVIFDGKRAVKNDILKNREGDSTSLDFTKDGEGEVIVERYEHVQAKV